ncbi:MAG: PHP domain-containing protein [Chloroflexota bacterium]|nr:MAG: PHP domain-containing protein [Chloroflexota bacterium]
MLDGYSKCDLHVHTPLSNCYEPAARHVKATEIVDAALEAGLDLIAITDHNGVGAVDGVRQAAEQTGLVVLPGVEITTPGGHILALFDRGTPSAEIRLLLNEVGLSPSNEGEAFVETRLGTVEALAAIRRHGGLAIAAHIERSPRGFLESTYDFRRKRAIHASEHLSALEITNPLRKAAWNAGKVHGYPKPYACVQGSDAHALEDIGRRPVLIRLASIDLAGLDRALAEYPDAIRFPDEMVSPHVHTCRVDDD